jgi:oligopeptide transport system ATP-binding protein
MATVLEVQDLRVRFETHQGVVRAVDGVSFKLDEGETLGIVGESGSGKSVTSLALMGLVPQPPGVVSATRLVLGRRDLLTTTPAELRGLRGKEIAMIFQDPMTSLNPLLTVERQLTEVLERHEGLSRRQARKRAATALGEVGIPAPESRLDSYPHQLSGGMRQRVMIAMALLCNPRVLIADEPTTALDVTIQAQILELMKDLQRRHGMAIALITHDLGVVAGMSDRLQVMYGGRVVETGATDEVFARPLHPYTLALLASVPRLTGDPGERLAAIEGSPPDLAALPAGCAFAPRCPFAIEPCRAAVPPLDAPAAGRKSACIRAEHLLVAPVAGGAR